MKSIQRGKLIMKRNFGSSTSRDGASSVPWKKRGTKINQRNSTQVRGGSDEISGVIKTSRTEFVPASSNSDDSDDVQRLIKSQKIAPRSSLSKGLHSATMDKSRSKTRKRKRIASGENTQQASLDIHTSSPAGKRSRIEKRVELDRELVPRRRPSKFKSILSETEGKITTEKDIVTQKLRTVDTVEDSNPSEDERYCTSPAKNNVSELTRMKSSSSNRNSADAVEMEPPQGESVPCCEEDSEEEGGEDENYRGDEDDESELHRERNDPDKRFPPTQKYTLDDREYLVNRVENSIEDREADGFDETDPLTLLLRKQAEENRIDRLERGEDPRIVDRRGSLPYGLAEPGISTKDLWECEILRRKREFYFGKESELKVSLRVFATRAGSKRSESFKAISVNESNNIDVRHASESIFARSARNGTGEESWAQFRICVGQFLRPCIAYHRVDLDDAWKPGAFYKVAEDKYIFQAFLQFFRGKGKAGSVMNKAKLLGRFVKGAIMYFLNNPRFNDEDENRKFQSKMEETLIYLNQMAAVNKKQSRLERARAKEERPRIEAGKYIPEEDFDDFRKEALELLSGVMKTVKDKVEETGKNDMETKLDVFRSLVVSRKGLLDKWGLNFTAMLVFFGNGQRNQVFRLLNAPLLPDLLTFERENEENDRHAPIKMDLIETAVEKVPRDIRIPYIMFDNVILPFLKFHVEFVRPILLERALENGNRKTNYLLLHTKLGKKLTSQNIRYAIVTFVKRMNPDAHLTPKDIRASFSTYMIRRYVKARTSEQELEGCFQSLEPQAFKEMMAAVMNTSVRMLDQVYMESSHSSFGDHIARVLKLGDFSSRIDFSM